MSRKYLYFFTAVILVALAAAACQQASGPAPAAPVETVIVTVEVPVESSGGGDTTVAMPSSDTLQTIQDRGKLICGSRNDLPGFGFLNEDGSLAGFEIDFCGALAAAIFGDSSKVEIRHMTSKERFTLLQTGEIDVIVRTTTWTLQRDSELGANFVHSTFYDGQGMMASAASGVTALEDLADATICVGAGTTTELNLADVFATRGIPYTPLVFENIDESIAALEEGRCDAFTTDKSGLVARRTTMANPGDWVILDETMSKEPLGPAVRHGDDAWFDIVQWVVYATFTAEEFGITSANVDDFLAAADNPSVNKLLGVEGEMGTKLGLSDDWAYNVIKQIGNYGEIYDRNLGPDTLTYIPRGLNMMYTEGGLMYAPPVR